MTDPATIFEEWSVPAIFAPNARLVLDAMAIPADARILDVACGSGIVARTVASRLGSMGRVVGLDFNPGMLTAARRASAAEGLTIEWMLAGAQELPFADGAFDLVFCQHGLQFFPDRAGAVAEMFRVLAPGGEIAISTWRGLDQNPFSAAYERAVRRRFDSFALSTPFSLGDPAELRGLLLQAGFRDVSVEPVEIEASFPRPESYTEMRVRASAAGVPALQSLSAAELDTLVAAVREDLEEPVRAATRNGCLRFPMRGIVARGVRR
jgi:ubiquinone/menaquinone biosynthesis C-methylase UbiE